MNFHTVISRAILLVIIVFTVALSACDEKLSDTGKTPVVFKPSLSTSGISWKEGDQLLITYSTDAASELTACYQYENSGDQWMPIAKDNTLYVEEVKSVSQIEGFGQSSNPPTGAIYSIQSSKANYLSTRHLLCAAPLLSSDKRMLEATMESRAVHMIVKLTGVVPKQVAITLEGEVPVKMYKNASDDSFAVFTAHLKLWHIPGITMSEDNNTGTIVTPGSLFATVDYINSKGINKTSCINNSVRSNMSLIRGDQLSLVVDFQETDVLETSATVSSVWSNTIPID